MKTVVEESGKKRPLDDVMLAMDVVDTLRHRSRLIERELNEEQRDEELIEKLRQIYSSQGIDVPEEILVEGVEALKEDRFTYSPPEETFSTRLAKLYVSRDQWLRPVVIGCSLLFIGWLAFQFFIAGPREREIRALPERIASAQQSIEDASNDGEGISQAQSLANEAAQAFEQQDYVAVREKLAELEQLNSKLNQSYDLRIVKEGSTGVWRIPDVNQSARNYYIIVEAVAPDGEVLSLPIQSEENGQTEIVSKWGIRVDESTFYQIADDKKDDGIIQNDRFGVKKSGSLEPEYFLPAIGGAITNW
ncbi:hypothetical protein KOR42_07650 [Thalassoglobus neptunius]|uniref:Uncharacterized protein n=1 Tax=Thalassoglobus neptunius TaxID=1938619 RepID=A0A5C5X2R1_9PLAN|nr:DUF6384 family protein [Thalassoglobus neptunius]TWT57404.1 hypothetical protein KOR42_07650 [Thalassoglobus neptunius]